MENLMTEERPPSWMWPFEDELDVWFANVEEERKNKYGGDDSDTDNNEPLMQNELAKGRG